MLMASAMLMPLRARLCHMRQLMRKDTLMSAPRLIDAVEMRDAYLSA